MLSGRVAVVTGAASGIGRASAEALARAGASVVVADIDEVKSRSVVDSIEAEGGRAIAFRTDVTEHEECAALVKRAVEEFGALHILHANAGIALPFRGDGFAPDIDPAAWDRVIKVNLSGVFYCAHYAIPAMIAKTVHVTMSSARVKPNCLSLCFEFLGAIRLRISRYDMATPGGSTEERWGTPYTYYRLPLTALF